MGALRSKLKSTDLRQIFFRERIYSLRKTTIKFNICEKTKHDFPFQITIIMIGATIFHTSNHLYIDNLYTISSTEIFVSSSKHNFKLISNQPPGDSNRKQITVQLFPNRPKIITEQEGDEGVILAVESLYIRTLPSRS